MMHWHDKSPCLLSLSMLHYTIVGVRSSYPKKSFIHGMARVPQCLKKSRLSFGNLNVKSMVGRAATAVQELHNAGYVCSLSVSTPARAVFEASLFAAG
jgi:hypothetical protein